MNDPIERTLASDKMIASPGWVRPNDIMKSRKLKAKRRALQERMSTSFPLQVLVSNKNKISSDSQNNKRRNPFKSLPSKNLKTDHQFENSENSSDGCIFELLNPFSKQPLKTNQVHDFAQLHTENLDNSPVPEVATPSQEWSDILHVDWSLKSKMRFYSSKPFPWKHRFKASEEASGTTGFVRCLNSESDNECGRTLDTSANAQFYQCCLFWQHPSLPMVSLFPRDKGKLSAQTGIFGADQKIASSLHTEWTESLRSLYQLLRVRQCPYFYVCGQAFTCLFRAAGVAGFPHTHALITPTTRGLRDSMKKEGVEFSMPLYNKKTNSDNEKIDLIDEIEDNCEEETKTELLKDEEKEEPSAWLETLGIQSSQFPGLNQSRVKIESKKFQGVDGSVQSLVVVEDMELQGFINFLLNCDSCVSTTGALAGVPPTLFSPVGFHGGTLKSLKINASQVRNSQGETQHSFEFQGPILPTTLLNLSSLLNTTIDSFTVSFAPVASTLPFRSLSPTFKASVPMAFAHEGLVDCGLGQEARGLLCHSSLNENDESKMSSTYKEIVCQNGRYLWIDK